MILILSRPENEIFGISSNITRKTSLLTQSFTCRAEDIMYAKLICDGEVIFFSGVVADHTDFFIAEM